MRIAHQLIGLVGFVVTAGWVTGAVIAVSAERTVASAMNQSEQLRAQILMQDIERAIDDRIGALRAFADDERLQSAIRAVNERREADPGWSAFAHEIDAEWIAAEQPIPLAAELMAAPESLFFRQRIETLRAHHGRPVFSEVFASDRNGAIVALSDRTSDFLQADEQWWQDAWSDGIAVADVAFDESSSTMALAVAVRIDDGDESLGVLKGLIEIGEITGLLDTHAELGVETSLMSERSGEIYATPQFGELAERLERSDTLDDQSAGFLRGGDLLETWVAGGHDLTGLDLHWSVRSIRDAAPTLEMMRSVKRQHLAAAIVVTLLVCALAGWAAGLIARRVRRLRRIAVRIGDGDFTARASFRWRDELADLGEALNDMAVGLRRGQQEHERRLALQVEHDHLQESAKAHTRVLGVIGHELRTPLAAIRTTTELLRDAAMPASDAQPHLENMVTISIRMAESLNSLIEAARISSGVAHWSWETVHVASLCDEAILVVEPSVDTARVRVDVVHEDCDLVVHGDADALRRALTNLLTNAARHTVEGSITVRTASLWEHGERWLEIIVEDTGTGIPEHLVGCLGQAFAMNSGVVGDDCVAGSGLGLAICAGIVAAHGGVVAMSPGEAGGTRVRVRLRSDLAAPVATSDRAARIAWEAAA